MEHIYDVIIIGGGPGGYSAALYATRAGLNAVVLEKMAAGGQMNLTDQIDNYPGFDEGIAGYELGAKMRAGAERFGAKTKSALVISADLQTTPKRVETSAGTFYGKTVILATGADHRPLVVAKEADFVGRGVGYCATCDGMFFRNKVVGVVGGGNTAAGDALYLSRICQKVILIHRRDTLRATKLYRTQLENTPNVEIRYNTTVKALLGEDRISGVKLTDVNTGEISTLELDGLFISVGQNPATELFRGQVDLDENGYIVADETTCTNIPGVFAVGDVRTKALRQVITAAADGAVAAHFAENYLTNTTI
ncbi:MAG: thioredoxin-disulfide reductase [Oscillospiraceae bacterium]|nr:thioredoxin-disulfide reductase [Oscillospiraceae bacterium]